MDELEKEKLNKKREALKLKKKEEKKSKIFKILIILLSIFILLLLGIIIYFMQNHTLNLYFGDKKITTSNHRKYKNVILTDVSEIVEDVLPSIVSVTSQSLIESGKYGIHYASLDGYTKGAGSGIIIGKNDTELLILTNYHVIENVDKIKVRLFTTESFTATVKGISKENDVAVLSLPLHLLSANTIKNIKIIRTGYSNDLKVGEGILAIGNALGYGESVTTGVISALDREVTVNGSTIHMMQINASINAGNSGGALLNSNGELIGLVTAKYASANVDGIGFAIPITDISSIISALMNDQKIDSIDLGIEGYIITDENNEYSHMPEGFYISKITSDSIAAKSSLVIGNIITQIDGNTVHSIKDITEVLNKKRENDTIKLKIKYVDGIEYKEKEITITLSDEKE